jgi:hypothetical protein
MICFREVLAIASRQQAKSSELRAATSLLCLLQRQWRADADFAVLGEIYG